LDAIIGFNSISNENAARVFTHLLHKRIRLNYVLMVDFNCTKSNHRKVC